MSIKLTSVNVQKIFNECLGEGDKSIVIKPAITSPSFCRKKLEQHKDETTEMVKQLSTYSPGSIHDLIYIDLYMNKNGQQWTDSVLICDMLVALGIATGQITYYQITGRIPQIEFS